MKFTIATVFHLVWNCFKEIYADRAREELPLETLSNIRIHIPPIIRQETTGNAFYRDNFGKKGVHCNFDFKYELNTLQKTKGDTIILVCSVMLRKTYINPKSFIANLKYYYVFLALCSKENMVSF